MACILRRKLKAWTNGELPYVIQESGFTQSALTDIDGAIAHWNKNTNWHLLPRSTQKDYVEFRIGDVCSSHVGRKGNKQAINLANDCGFGAVVHEIGHAVGFAHEHSRQDRDNYVVVMPERVEPNKKHNYNKVNASQYLDYGRYDYDSIMHYGERSFLRRKRYDWTHGWSEARFYRIVGETYLFMLKTGNGVVHVHRMDATVGVGHEIQRHDWTSGWTTAETFSVGGATYLFLLKSKNGAIHIHRMENDGTVGKKVKSYDWSSGWTSAEFYKVGGKQFGFFLKESDGTVDIHRMENDGTVGERVKRYNWSSGWTSTEFHEVDDELFGFFLKECDGIVDIHRMRDDGTVGRQLRMTPEITMYAPESIGHGSELSDGDIAAANYRSGKAEPVKLPDSVPLSPYSPSSPLRTRRQRKVYGNRRTKELHVGSCTHGSKMQDENRVSFASIDEGVAQGYNGCFYCLRRYDTG